jgi:putative ABC transport system permease protein
VATKGQRLHVLREGVTIALDSIRANKVRAGLTILGIAVGVFVVVVISAAIHGINASVAKDLESTGPTTFFVSRFPISFEACDGTDETCKFFRNPRLTLTDVDALQRLPTVRTAGARLDTQRAIAYKDHRLRSVDVNAFTGNWQQIDGGGDIYPGRNFTQNEATTGERVVVINDELAKQAFGDSDPLDKMIEIGDVPFKVLGIYHYQASFLSGGNKPRAIVPIESARKHLKVNWNDIGIAVIPVATATRAEAIDDVIAAMRGRHALRPGTDNDFAIITQDQLFEVYNKIFGAFFLVMIVLSAVGLIVGGVGVIAIMMISVTERTREIGVRKALGARRREILWQFLIEAAFLTSAGGVLGIFFGSSIGLLVHWLSGFPVSLPWWSFAIGIGFSASIGIFFGLFPAIKASRLDPIEALRYE